MALQGVERQSETGAKLLSGVGQAGLHWAEEPGRGGEFAGGPPAAAAGLCACGVETTMHGFGQEGSATRGAGAWESYRFSLRDIM